QPDDGHPHHSRRRLLAKALCLYDNAGEHFLPGGESAGTPVEHLALSEALLFLFDPTQHPKFRKQCNSPLADPQMGEHGKLYRQDRILLEAAKRIRIQSGWPQDAKYKKPLIVVVTKYDAWCSMIHGERLYLNQVVRKTGTSVTALDITTLRAMSSKVRDVLVKNAREVVQAAENFCSEVIYVPVSALGRSPEINEAAKTLENGKKPLGIRPRDIDPMWCEVPILYALRQLVRRGKQSQDPSTEQNLGRQKSG
ncbi:hypothetical protein ACFL2H_03785, partial [Planctomycetota bacterium]